MNQTQFPVDVQACIHVHGSTYQTHLHGTIEDVGDLLSEIARYQSTAEMVADIFAPPCADCTDSECHHDYPDVRVTYDEDLDEIRIEPC